MPGGIRLDRDRGDGAVDCGSQIESAIDGGVRVSAAGVQLVAVFRNLPPQAEAVGDPRLVMGLAGGAEEAAVAFEDTAGARESGAREVGGEDAVEGGLAG